MASLRIDGLAKQFADRQVLAGLDLCVSSGELLAVLGTSGCGKTTLLRLIAGFEQADAGTIEIDGEPVAAAGRHEPPERRRVGYLAQEGALFPHLSVEANVGFGIRRRSDRRSRVADLLDMVGLARSYAKRFPHQLSGGEQQRVALARALAPMPRIMLLDEPFSALDATLRRDVRDVVATTLKRAGTTALLVTHDQAEALSMGDRVAVLRDGRIAQVADPVSLYRDPVDPEVARFVGEAVLLAGVVRNGVVSCALGALTAIRDRTDGPVEVLIRPEQIRILTQGTPDTVCGQVSSVTFYGHDAVVELALLHGTGGTIRVRVLGQVAPTPGRAVGVAVDGAVVTYACPRVYTRMHRRAAPPSALPGSSGPLKSAVLPERIRCRSGEQSRVTAGPTTISSAGQGPSSLANKAGPE
jgi:iron(III) transport system ATP-binding protein